jgi:hypothetical protein
MGSVGQSALEVAMFTAAIERASADAGVKNYCKATIDLVHTYSFLELDLVDKDKSADWCLQYLKSRPWAATYFQTKLGSSEIRKPKGIYEYMTLLDGNVCAIQFSDNNGGTISPFGGSSKGSATGSHHVLGDGRIDFMEYMDALFNYAHLNKTAILCGGAYLVYEPWYNNINDANETIVAQKRLVDGIGEGTMWMKEWNLLYNVARVGTDTQAAVAASGQVSKSSKPDGGKNILIPGFESIALEAGQKKAAVSLQNPAGNPCKFVISLLSKDGKVLYKSKSIAPGKAINEIKINEALNAGTYDATIKYESYGLADQILMNGASVKVKLIVE